jgi:competence protein ComEC
VSAGRALDPDPDGVALAVATAAGVLLGTHLPAPPAWAFAAASASTLALAAACLAAPRRPAPAWPVAGRFGGGHGTRATTGGARGRPLPGGAPGGPSWGGARSLPGGARGGLPAGGARAFPRGGARRGAAAGVLVLATLGTAGAAVAAARVDAVRGGVLPARVGRPGVVEVAGTVAEEPRPLPHHDRWVVLSVHRVGVGGRTWRTRERAGVVLPAAAGPLGAGDRLRLRAGVGRARRADRLGHRPPVALRHPQVEARAPPASVVLRASEALRAAARRSALASLAPDRAGLLVGMALGDTSLLPGDLDGAFRAAGLSHLVAVSGANLAVVLGAGLWLAAAARLARPVLVAAGIALVASLVVLTRWEPSVLRAGVMAVLVLLGVATGRGPGGRRALCLAVVLLLLADPGLAGALGFQLSVAATAGILWVGPLATNALPRFVPDRARTAAGVTLGAQAVALPVLALAFGRLSPASLPANLLGLPLATGPMLLGVAAAVTAPAAPWLSSLACRLADPFLVGLVAIARWAARLPGAELTLRGPLRAAPAAALALVLATAARRHRRRRSETDGRADSLRPSR